MSNDDRIPYAQSEGAEDWDEDELQLDPLEAGMDPPEHWAEADKYGMTQWEQAHPRPLSERLAEEQGERPEYSELDAEADAQARHAGREADQAGGSMASSARSPVTDDSARDG